MSRKFFFHIYRVQRRQGLPTPRGELESMAIMDRLIESNGTWALEAFAAFVVGLLRAAYAGVGARTASVGRNQPSLHVRFQVTRGVHQTTHELAAISVLILRGCASDLGVSSAVIWTGNFRPNPQLLAGLNYAACLTAPRNPRSCGVRIRSELPGLVLAIFGRQRVSPEWAYLPYASPNLFCSEDIH